MHSRLCLARSWSMAAQQLNELIIWIFHGTVGAMTHMDVQIARFPYEKMFKILYVLIYHSYRRLYITLVIFSVCSLQCKLLGNSANKIYAVRANTLQCEIGTKPLPDSAHAMPAERMAPSPTLAAKRLAVWPTRPGCNRVPCYITMNCSRGIFIIQDANWLWSGVTRFVFSG